MPGNKRQHTSQLVSLQEYLHAFDISCCNMSRLLVCCARALFQATGGINAQHAENLFLNSTIAVCRVVGIDGLKAAGAGAADAAGVDGTQDDDVKFEIFHTVAHYETLVRKEEFHSSQA